MAVRDAISVILSRAGAIDRDRDAVQRIDQVREDSRDNISSIFSLIEENKRKKRREDALEFASQYIKTGAPIEDPAGLSMTFEDRFGQEGRGVAAELISFDDLIRKRRKEEELSDARITNLQARTDVTKLGSYTDSIVMRMLSGRKDELTPEELTMGRRILEQSFEKDVPTQITVDGELAETLKDFGVRPGSRVDLQDLVRMVQAETSRIRAVSSGGLEDTLNPGQIQAAQAMISELFKEVGINLPPEQLANIDNPDMIDLALSSLTAASTLTRAREGIRERQDRGALEREHDVTLLENRQAHDRAMNELRIAATRSENTEDRALRKDLGDRRQEAFDLLTELRQEQLLLGGLKLELDAAEDSLTNQRDTQMLSLFASDEEALQDEALLSDYLTSQDEIVRRLKELKGRVENQKERLRRGGREEETRPPRTGDLTNEELDDLFDSLEEDE